MTNTKLNTIDDYVNSIDTSDVTDEMRLKVFAREWKETSKERAANEAKILKLTKEAKELDEKTDKLCKVAICCSIGVLALFATSVVVNLVCRTDEE